MKEIEFRKKRNQSYYTRDIVKQFLRLHTFQNTHWYYFAYDCVKFPTDLRLVIGEHFAYFSNLLGNWLSVLKRLTMQQI